MPSIETQNVSSAVAQSVQPVTQQAPAQNASNATPQQVSQASQDAVSTTIVSPRRNDADRTTQVPKKTEAAFAPQKAKKRAKKGSDSSSDSSEHSSSEKSLNVTA